MVCILPAVMNGDLSASIDKQTGRLASFGTLGIYVNRTCILNLHMLSLTDSRDSRSRCICGRTDMQGMSVHIHNRVLRYLGAAGNSSAQLAHPGPCCDQLLVRIDGCVFGKFINTRILFENPGLQIDLICRCISCNSSCKSICCLTVRILGSRRDASVLQTALSVSIAEGNISCLHHCRTGCQPFRDLYRSRQISLSFHIGCIIQFLRQCIQHGINAVFTVHLNAFTVCEESHI